MQTDHTKIVLDHFRGSTSSMLPSHNDLLLSLEKFSPRGERGKANALLNDLRSRLDAPAAGTLVGSNGPDWSFRLSIIFHDGYGRRGKFPTRLLIDNILHRYQARAKTEKYTISPTMKFALHSHLEVVRTTKEGIIKWSRWARANGVTHNGKWGYNFPNKTILDSLSAYASTPYSKRTVSSRKERKFRRSAKSASSTISVAYPDSPWTIRLLNSQSSLRKTWFSMSNRCSWSDFKKKSANRHVLCLGPVRSHRPSSLPSLVEHAVNKIYSRKSIYFSPTKLDPFPSVKKEEISQVLYPDFPTVLRERLNQIELNGFKETYTWFSLNHILSKTN